MTDGDRNRQGKPAAMRLTVWHRSFVVKVYPAEVRSRRTAKDMTRLAATLSTDDKGQNR